MERVTGIFDEIIALERAALERWSRGDPGGFLELSDPDVVYFDPFQPRRLDGISNLTAFYETLRGQVQLDRFELISPKVQVLGEGAVLTFNFISHTGDEEQRWNCTEAYVRKSGQWRIVQTHWSLTGPPKP